MKAVIQRVTEASVTVAGQPVSSIGKGLMILLGIQKGDTDEDRDYLLKKIPRLRIFDDENGVMNLDITQVGGEILLVSQFTLLANTRKGNRPSYIEAEDPEMATARYEEIAEALSEALGRPTQKGIFGADMQVQLVNDGPVTILIDSKNR